VLTPLLVLEQESDPYLTRGFCNQVGEVPDIRILEKAVIVVAAMPSSP
jgi:hypothetical protein